MSVLRPLPTDQARVLIVEDETALRKVLVRATTTWGFRVAAVWSGEEALKLNAATPFDVVILDYHLPGIDGIETLRRLREFAPHLQAIILTGFANIDVARQAIHLDVVEFLTKPCTQGDVEQAMGRALRRRLVEADVAPGAGDLAEPLGAAAADATLDEVERSHILATLSRNDGNRSATARTLGITRKTLLNKLRRYALQTRAKR